MANPTFASVLDMPAGDIERPKPLPVGSYITVVLGQPRIDKSTKKGTEFVEYTLKLLKALDDVDEEALDAIGGVKDKTIRHTFYLTRSSVYRLKDFLTHCGVEMEEEGSIREYITQATGKQVIAHIIHVPSQDGETVYANVKSTAPVE